MIGTLGNDVMVGTNADDLLDGGSGNDFLDGGAGNDSVYGGNGNDTIIYDPMDAIISGGNGIDWLDASTQLDRISVDSTDFADIENFLGGAGNDYIHCNFEYQIVDHRLEGGDGWDDIWGGQGNDLIYGGAGNDEFNAMHGNDTVYGEAGNDGLTGYAGNDLLYGGEGNDYLSGTDDDDTLHGGAGEDTYNWGMYVNGWNDGNDLILSDAFNYLDTLIIRDFRQDQLELEHSGNDLIVRLPDEAFMTIQDWFRGSEYEIGTFQTSNASFHPAIGTNVADLMTASDWNSSLFGLEGNDTLIGGFGDSALFGGAGNDVILSGIGPSFLYGGDGGDLLIIGSHY